ncbi:hypothetical protein ACLOJK_035255 [Asimina triloba]
MESSSQVSGDTEEEEECNRSESGWTKYLSPIMHDDTVDRDSDEDYDRRRGGHADDDDDSDDSMASDARSGPYPSEVLYNDAKMVHPKNDDDEGNEDDIGYSKKKSSQPKELRNHEGGKKKEEKKDPPGDGNSNLLCRSTKQLALAKKIDHEKEELVTENCS